MSVIYEKNGRIAKITIDRPEAMNALDAETFTELCKALVDFRDDRDLWVAILTGAGDRAFSAGADLKTLIPGRAGRKSSSQGAPNVLIFSGLNIMKPMIAAVNGHCLAGGLGLALLCDIRIAAENATFGTMGVKRGIIPGAGQTQRLPRLISLAKAFEMFFLAEKIDAHEAYRIGLVNLVVPQGDLLTIAGDWARKISENAPLAIKATKEAVLRGLALPIDQGLRLESLLGDPMNYTEDFKEGVRAFAEKRKPQFTGR
ncbi:MAG: enoyl-CoA hydratase-related protein [Dehalococcoidia bacterium]|nr:enoyl-CoA hydratase-related protein [Dehalococcoidia bacterium]